MLLSLLQLFFSYYYYVYYFCYYYFYFFFNIINIITIVIINIIVNIFINIIIINNMIIIIIIKTFIFISINICKNFIIIIIINFNFINNKIYLIRKNNVIIIINIFIIIFLFVILKITNFLQFSLFVLPGILIQSMQLQTMPSTGRNSQIIKFLRRFYVVPSTKVFRTVRQKKIWTIEISLAQVFRYQKRSETQKGSLTVFSRYRQTFFSEKTWHPCFA